MGYAGTSAAIPLGQLGLLTDEPQAAIPPNAAIKANNISLYRSRVEKARGTAKYSATELEAGVVAGFDWWPTATSQRQVVATSNGKVWKDTGDGTWSTATALGTIEVQKIAFSAVPDSGSVTFEFNGVSASSGLSVLTGTTAAQVQTNLRTIPALAACVVSGTVTQGFLVRMDGTTGNQVMLTTSANTLTSGGPGVTFTFSEVFQGGATLGTIASDSQFVSGGAEASGNAKKLFFFSGGVSQVKVLQGDGSAIGNIQTPAADWSTSFPTFGLVYNGRMLALMGHNLYISKLNDHENFNSGGATAADSVVQPIYAGEGESLIGAIEYKGLVLLFKRPFGVYVFQWQDQSSLNNIQVSRYSNSFGIASPHATAICGNDLIGGSNANSLTSLQASDALGSLEQGDLLKATRVRDYIRSNLDASGIQHMHSCFYPEKETAYFTGRVGSGSSTNDRMLVVDFSRQQPRLSIETKDRPACLWLRKDTNKVPRPVYGAADGYVYLLDQTNRNVANAAYIGEFQTPFIDFSYLDASLADKSKLFDFLQVSYTSTGNFSFYIDVYCDGNFSETLTFSQAYGAVMGTFELDVSRFGELLPRSARKPLHCTGKAISFRIYNSTLNESFNVERFVVGFRVSGEQNKSSTD